MIYMDMKKAQRKSYYGQISHYLNNDKTSRLPVNEIPKYAEDRMGWELLIAGSKVLSQKTQTMTNDDDDQKT